MKILEYKRKAIFDVGFIDPYVINFVTMRDFGNETENNMLRFFKKQNTRTEILFPYNFE